jgi:dihydroorotate dehydrogenase
LKRLGIEFGRAWNAAGARGFFGEGYWFHRRLGPLGPDFGRATFVAKTTTVEPRAGNMPLDGITPRELVPRCIRVNFRAGAVLNAVGLAGPGLDALLADGRWQSRLDPFFLSFMAVDPDRDRRLAKATAFAERVAAHRPRFRAPFGIQVNLSCPNVGHDPVGLAGEAAWTLDRIARHLPGVPLVPKLNALVPAAVAARIADHPHCAALVMGNTLPWGSLPDRVDWRGLFGAVSPLARYGGGGLGGAPLLPIVWDWLDAARSLPGGFPCPLIGGGGILSVDDAICLSSAGAVAIHRKVYRVLAGDEERAIRRSMGDRPLPALPEKSTMPDNSSSGPTNKSEFVPTQSSLNGGVRP